MERTTWESMRQSQPEFVEVFHAAFKSIPRVVLETSPEEDDDAGKLLIALMVASMPDFDDILLLCSHDSHWGALKLLRILFERTVALKYIAQNRTEAKTFLAFDAKDWKAILEGIETHYGLKPNPETLQAIDADVKGLRDKFKQERCAVCGMRKSINWTPHSSLTLAQKVGLEHLHFEAFELPSKFIHPTYFGTRWVSNDGVTPLPNILKATHVLAIETLLTHQIFFKDDPLASPSVKEAVSGFFRVWKYAATDFGLGKKGFERLGLGYPPGSNIC